MASFSDYYWGGRKGHLIGIGGVSMSPLAEVLAEAGLIITGSDMNDGAKIVGHLLGNNSNAVVQQASQKSGLSLGQTLKILSIAAPLIMSLLGKTAQSQQQAQVQQVQGSTFTPLTQQAQQQSALGGINIGSIMGALLKNVDVGKILLSLLK